MTPLSDADVPLLSICVPTYGRAELLETCLSTILPQIATLDPMDRSMVECIVCDNASTDRTPQVIADFAGRFPLRAFRNDKNFGILGNITKVATVHATGQFVWLIGDDDLLAEDAIATVLQFLRSAPSVNLCALNVGFFPAEQRPSLRRAEGGIAESPPTRLRRVTKSGLVARDQLFEGPCADLTAMYSVVLRRSLWMQEFPKPYMEPAFQDVRSTYPHSYIIATRVPNEPCLLIADPMVMIYEMPSDQFSWAKYHAKTAILHATSLLKLYEKSGVPYGRLKPYYEHQLTDRALQLGDLMWNPDSAGGLSDAARFVAMMSRRHPILMAKAFAIAMMNPHAPKLLSAPFHLAFKLKRLGSC